MKVMRFSSNRGKSHFHLKSVDSKIIDAAKYPITPNKYSVIDVNSLIPKCFMKEYDKDSDPARKECNLFQPVVTDMGICPSYNPTPMMQLFEQSHYMDSFLDSYAEDFVANYSIKIGEKSGKTLKFYLTRSPKSFSLDKVKDEQPAIFQVGISSSMEFLGMKSSSIDVKAGYKTTIYVEPMEIVASEDLRSIQIEKRQCHFNEELIDLKLFKYYTQSGCEFERQLYLGLEKCFCVPWFIPTPFGQNYSICDLYGNTCFEEVVKHFKFTEECLPNCNLLQFTQSKVLEKLDDHEICNNYLSSIYKLSAMKFSGKGIDFLLESLKLKEWLDNPFKTANETYDEELTNIKFCQHMVKFHMAQVEVMFGTKKYIRTKMGVKVSFSDKLGVFGKFAHFLPI